MGHEDRERRKKKEEVAYEMRRKGGENKTSHKRLFEENVRKTRKVWSTNFKCERFESCFYAQGRY